MAGRKGAKNGCQGEEGFAESKEMALTFPQAPNFVVTPYFIWRWPVFFVLCYMDSVIAAKSEAGQERLRILLHVSDNSRFSLRGSSIHYIGVAEYQRRCYLARV